MKICNIRVTERREDTDWAGPEPTTLAEIVEKTAPVAGLFVRETEEGRGMTSEETVRDNVVESRGRQESVSANF